MGLVLISGVLVCVGFDFGVLFLVLGFGFCGLLVAVFGVIVVGLLFVFCI